MNNKSNSLFKLEIKEMNNFDIFEIEVLKIMENRDWLNMYEDIFKEKLKSTYRFLINNMRGYDGIDVNGFSQLVKLCKRYNIIEMNVAVLTTDSARIVLKELFLIKSSKLDYNFNLEVFGIKEKAIDWLVQD